MSAFPEPGPLNIYQLALRHRKALIARDAEASKLMAQAYREAYARIVESLNRAVALMERRKQQGTPKLWRSYQIERLEEVKAQIAREMATFSGFAAELITSEQRNAVQKALAESSALVGAAVDHRVVRASVNFNRAPKEALESLVGFLGDGSPLKQIFDGYGVEASSAGQEIIKSGLIAGHNPRKIARKLSKPLGGNLTRALTIARTEVLRSYRSAAQENYRANDDVVLAWQWVAALNSRTCPICWGMHGSIHPLSQQFASHIKCRCSPVPVTEYSLSMMSGVTEFETLDDGTKRKILGKGKFQLYDSGQIELSDLIGDKNDPAWGESRFEKPIKDLELRKTRPRARVIADRLAAPALPENPLTPSAGGSTLEKLEKAGDRLRDDYGLPSWPKGQADADLLIGSAKRFPGGVNDAFEATDSDGNSWFVKALTNTSQYGGIRAEFAAVDIANELGLGEYFSQRQFLVRSAAHPGIADETDLFVQEWLPMAEFGADPVVAEKTMDALDRIDREKLALMDIVCGNGDRHEANIALSGGKIKMLDHERFFSTGVSPAEVLDRAWDEYDLKTDDGTMFEYSFDIRSIEQVLKSREDIVAICKRYRIGVEVLTKNLDVLSKFSESDRLTVRNLTRIWFEMVEGN